ncbi:Adrenodoxin [Sarcoptes scabiei]|nr:Adrenodoxin [Sarcoptes scabiei]
MLLYNTILQRRCLNLNRLNSLYRRMISQADSKNFLSSSSVVRQSTMCCNKCNRTESSGLFDSIRPCDSFCFSSLYQSKRLLCSKSNQSDEKSTQRFVFLNDSKADQPKRESNLTVIFELDNGKQLVGKACHGDTLYDVVVTNNLEIDGFGTLACSTCHLILSNEDYQKISSEITDEEMDMLDLACGLTETSRLGCRIHMTKELDGLKVKVPAAMSDARDK